MRVLSLFVIAGDFWITAKYQKERRKIFSFINADAVTNLVPSGRVFPPARPGSR